MTSTCMPSHTDSCLVTESHFLSPVVLERCQIVDLSFASVVSRIMDVVFPLLTY